MSDGCPHAGHGQLATISAGSARTSSAFYGDLLRTSATPPRPCPPFCWTECNRLYGGQPGDDTTACVSRIRKREPMNLLFGPPSNRDDCEQDDVAVLLQRGQAYRLRRHHLLHGRQVSRQKAREGQLGLLRRGDSAHRRNRGRGPGHRRASSPSTRCSNTPRTTWAKTSPMSTGAYKQDGASLICPAAV